MAQGDNNFVGFVLNSDKGELRILTSMTQEGDTLILDQFSIEGLGKSSLGLQSTRQYAREIGKTFGGKGGSHKRDTENDRCQSGTDTYPH